MSGEQYPLTDEDSVVVWRSKHGRNNSRVGRVTSLCELLVWFTDPEAFNIRHPMVNEYMNEAGLTLSWYDPVTFEDVTCHVDPTVPGKGFTRNLRVQMVRSEKGRGGENEVRSIRYIPLAVLVRRLVRGMNPRVETVARHIEGLSGIVLERDDTVPVFCCWFDESENDSGKVTDSALYSPHGECIHLLQADVGG